MTSKFIVPGGFPAKAQNSPGVCIGDHWDQCFAFLPVFFRIWNCDLSYHNTNVKKKKKNHITTFITFRLFGKKNGQDWATLNYFNRRRRFSHFIHLNLKLYSFPRSYTCENCLLSVLHAWQFLKVKKTFIFNHINHII